MTESLKLPVGIDKKIIELSQMKDEKDSQRIGRLRTRKDGRRLWA